MNAGGGGVCHRRILQGEAIGGRGCERGGKGVTRERRCNEAGKKFKNCGITRKCRSALLRRRKIRTSSPSANIQPRSQGFSLFKTGKVLGTRLAIRLTLNFISCTVKGTWISTFAKFLRAMDLNLID